MAERFLLCRPQGGLNDMLCQIEACCRYGEQHDRTVIVDTHYQGAAYFRDDFRNYFQSRQSRLVLSVEDVKADLGALTVFPEFIQGRVNAYSTVFGPLGIWNAAQNREGTGWMDTQTRRSVTFDFSKAYPHELLVHHDLGRNTIAMYALMRLAVTRKVSDELKSRLRKIGSPYDAIHIRHTDYKSSYRPALEALRKSPPARLFVATDNIMVLKEFQAALGMDRVFSFSHLPANADVPVHKQDLTGEQRFATNRDAIVDLLMIALSRQLILVKLEAGPTYSGFSDLAHTLWASKIVLKHLLAREDIRFGLD